MRRLRHRANMGRTEHTSIRKLNHWYKTNHSRFGIESDLENGGKSAESPVTEIYPGFYVNYLLP